MTVYVNNCADKYVSTIQTPKDPTSDHGSVHVPKFYLSTIQKKNMSPTDESESIGAYNNYKLQVIELQKVIEAMHNDH